jgi:tetratricopeptide (TPR) repeat protein
MGSGNAPKSGQPTARLFPLLRGKGGGDEEGDIGSLDAHNAEDHVDAVAEAERLWIRAVDASPSDAPLLFEYALFLQDDKKDWLGAERMYKRVLSLDPTHVAAMSNYGMILSEQREDLDGAERVFQLALILNPNDGTALANFAALVLDKHNEPRRAQELYLCALRADPSNTATLYNYAVLLEDHAGDLRGASRMLQIALHLEPSLRDVRERLATVERLRAHEACASRRKRQGNGRHSRPDSGSADADEQENEGKREVGGVEREEVLFRAAVMLEPANPLALTDYARLLLRQGKVGDELCSVRVCARARACVRCCLFDAR